MSRTKQSAVRVAVSMLIVVGTFVGGIASVHLSTMLSTFTSSPQQLTSTGRSESLAQAAAFTPQQIALKEDENLKEALHQTPETMVETAGIKPLVVSPNRLLITAGNSLYMMDLSKRVVWQWSAGEDKWPLINDQPLILGEMIYVIGPDLMHVALDVTTGEERWRGTSSGKAVYKQIERYKDDQRLVLADLSGYDDPRIERYERNQLTAFRGQELVWATDFPRDAMLQVWAGKIYAVIYKAGNVEMIEIKPPDEDGVYCSC